MSSVFAFLNAVYLCVRPIVRRPEVGSSGDAIVFIVQSTEAVLRKTILLWEVEIAFPVNTYHDHSALHTHT